MVKILAISGSLRSDSTNTALLRAAALVAPPGATVTMYEGIGDLPLFNPDIEGPEFDGPAPANVQKFRDHLRASDGVMLATPEYAHGVSGVIKNALDWVVGTGELVDKPILFFNASPRASIAYDSLKGTIKVMGGVIDENASITLPILGSSLDPHGILSHPELSAALRSAMAVFTARILVGPLEFAPLGI